MEFRTTRRTAALGRITCAIMHKEAGLNPLEEFSACYFAQVTLCRHDVNIIRHQYLVFSRSVSKMHANRNLSLQKYCETAYSRSGVNQMWILKNSKELLDILKSPNFNLITNIKSVDFSTLYTTLPFPTRNKKQASNYNTELLPSQKWKSEIQIFGVRSRGTLFCEGTSTLKKTSSRCSSF